MDKSQVLIELVQQYADPLSSQMDKVHAFTTIQGIADSIPQWISVKDRLPEKPDKEYLAKLDTGFICMVFFNLNKEWVEMWGSKKMLVIEWTNLPQSKEK